MSQNGPKMAQEGPSWPQDGPKMSPRWPNMAPRGPHRGQHGAKIAPKSVQKGLLDDPRGDHKQDKKQLPKTTEKRAERLDFRGAILDPN